MATVVAVVGAARDFSGFYLSFFLAVVAAPLALLAAAAATRRSLIALSLVVACIDVGVIVYWAYTLFSGLGGAR